MGGGGATFGDVGVALPVVDDEAPEETGDEVEEVAADAVAHPRLHRVRQAAPPVAWRHGAEDDLVVPLRLRDEPLQVVAAVRRCRRQCRRPPHWVQCAVGSVGVGSCKAAEA
jgi:hypothetical protein